MQKIFSQLSDILSADIIKLIIVFCIIGIIFSGLFNYILSYYFDFDVENIKDWVNGYGQYAPRSEFAAVDGIMRSPTG